MIQISEWLPNPVGSDLRGEFVELFNAGSRPVSLSGWVLKTQGKSKAKLSGTIGAGEYLLLKRSSTKLVLKNTDEKLFLYDQRGNLVDQSGFFGMASEGKSFSRAAAGPDGAQNFFWSDPTPGGSNRPAFDASIIRNGYPFGSPLGRPAGYAQFSAVLLGSSVVLAAIILYAFKKHEDISKLFFQRDEEIWL